MLINQKNKKLLLLIPLISALAAALANITNPLNLILIVAGILTFYIVSEATASLLNIIIVCIFIPYFVVIQGLHITSSDFIMFICFIVWLFKALVLRKNIYIPKFYIFLGLFLASLLISLFSAINMATGIKEILQFIQMTITYTMVINNLITSTDQIKTILRLSVYSAFVIATFAIMYFLMGNVQGLYNLGFHKNAIGSLMALSFPIALINSRTRPSMYNFIIMLVIGGGLGVSLSRGAWVGAFCGVMLMEILYHKKDLLRNILASVILILFAFSVMPTQFKESAVSSHTLTFRQEQWEIAKIGFRRHPWTGVGYANFSTLSQTLSQYRPHEDPHNVAFRFAAELGIVGLAAFTILFIVIYYYCYAVIKKETDQELRWFEIGLWASLIAYLIHGMFDIFWVRGTGSYFWIFVSLIILLKEQRPKLKENTYAK